MKYYSENLQKQILSFCIRPTREMINAFWFFNKTWNISNEK